MSDKLNRLFWSDVMKDDNGASSKKSATKITTAKSRLLLPECSHWRQPFELRDGLVVLASSWFDRPQPSNRGRGSEPEIGLYLDPRWADSRMLVSPGFAPPLRLKSDPDTRVILFPWSDYGVPTDVRLYVRTLKWILKENGKGASVEVGCMGGHGRTGTTLACLLVLQGTTATKAKRYVWARYCDQAIETRGQEELIQTVGKYR